MARPRAALIAIALSALAAPSGALAAVVGIPAANPSVLVQLGQSSLRLSAAIDNDGLISGNFSLVSCDGSVREAISCDGSVIPDATLEIGLTGSIFPFIDGSISFTDSGAPTPLFVTFSTLIPAIDGLADTELSGSVTAPAGRITPVVTSLPGGSFIEGAVGGPGGLAVAADVGDGSIDRDDSAPVTETYGPLTGLFNCVTLGGCNLLVLSLGIAGAGGGETYALNGRFDLDASVSAQVPVPAPAALLLTALGALGAVRSAGRKRA